MSAGADFNHDFAINRLYRRWRLFSLLSFLLLLTGFGLIWTFWRPDYALRWLILPSLATIYLITLLRGNLTSNHRLDEPHLLPFLGWGNILTLLRGLLVAWMSGFLLLPTPPGWLIWVPGLLYVLSDVFDFSDGVVARLLNQSTRLGEILDMRLDGAGVLVASLLAVSYGQVPFWYLAVAFAYPLFMAGLWLRRKLARPVYPLSYSFMRRIFAGLQMGFLAVVLLPLFSPPGTHIAAALFALPLLVNFLTDWLHVSGVIKPGGLPAPIQKTFSTVLPLLLRLVVLALNLLILYGWFETGESASPLFLILSTLNALLVILIVLGVLPRITAIFALCMLGFYQMFSPLTFAQILLAVVYTAILYLGGGRFSLWNPEERLFHRRLAERREPTRASRALEQGV